MIEYILDYLANRGVYAASQGEQQQMEDGIARYLQENGLEDGNTGAYYQKYVSNHLQPPGRTDKNPVLAYGKNARLRAGGKVRPNYRSQADLRQFGINYFSFKLKIQKALETVRRVQGTLLTIASDHGQQLVRDSEIFYIEVQGHNLIYHTLHGDLTATGTLKQIEAQLKPSGFYRCNYCYLVNLRHVGFLDGSEVTVGQYKLQISRNRRKEFLQQLTQFYGRGGR